MQKEVLELLRSDNFLLPVGIIRLSRIRLLNAEESAIRKIMLLEHEIYDLSNLAFRKITLVIPLEEIVNCDIDRSLDLPQGYLLHLNDLLSHYLKFHAPPLPIGFLREHNKTSALL